MGMAMTKCSKFDNFEVEKCTNKTKMTEGSTLVILFLPVKNWGSFHGFFPFYAMGSSSEDDDDRRAGAIIDSVTFKPFAEAFAKRKALKHVTWTKL